MSAARATASCVLTAAIVSCLLLNKTGEISDRSLDLAVVVSGSWIVFTVGERIVGSPSLAGSMAVAFGAGLVLLQQWFSSLHYAPHLLIVIGNLLICYLFARGLLPGREPMLLQVIRLMGRRSIDDPCFRQFIRRQCAIWSLMTFATAAVAFVAMSIDYLDDEMAVALNVLIVVQIAWFALSHYYANIRYRRPETWFDTLRFMFRPGTWKQLAL